MSKLLYLLFFSPFILLCCYAASSANQEAPPVARPTAPSAVQTTNSFLNQGRTIGLARNRANRSPYAKAVKMLKDAENDEQKDEAITAIRGELEKQYEAFLKSNEQQIEELQKRIDGLKDQLDRRRKAKNRMVDLEVERIVNESEGLVWPSNGNGRNGFFGTLRSSAHNPMPAKSFPGVISSGFPAPANPGVIPSGLPAPANNQRDLASPFGQSR